MPVSATVTITTIPRDTLVQDNNQAFDLELERWRIWDARQTNLGGSPSSDDLGIYTGTHGTHAPYITTGDVKNVDLTAAGRKAGITFRLPQNYVTAGGIVIAANAGMVTTEANTSATLEFSVYRLSNGVADTAIGTSGQLVTTAATDINDTTWAEQLFAIDASNLVAGDLLDIVATLKTKDTQNIVTVTGAFRARMLLAVRG